MMKGYIYRHWIVNDKGTVKSYIGQVRNRVPEQRWKKDGSGYKARNGSHKMSRAIDKYGWENFEHEILLKIECDTLDELVFWLDEWEKYYIEKYDSYYNGYNSTTGGSNGMRSMETREKIGRSLTGRVLPEQTRKKIGKTRKGIKPSNTGKPMAQEQKDKISKTMKGRKHPVSTRNKMRESHIGIHAGGKNPMATKVVCLNTGDIFGSCKEAREWCGGKGDIGACCKGDSKSAGKHPDTGERLAWVYLSDYDKLTKDEIDVRITAAKNTYKRKR